jgi:hypothetical protein
VKNADLSHYWFGPNRAQLKTFAQDAKWIEDEFYDNQKCFFFKKIEFERDEHFSICFSF